MNSGGRKNNQLPPPGAAGNQLNGESSNYTPGRIHVSWLPKNYITNDDLRVHFSLQSGHVVEAYVVNSNYAYNFGFVAFADPADVDRLMGENSSVIQIINDTTVTKKKVIIKRAWADHRGSGSQTDRVGDQVSDDESSREVARSQITLGEYIMPALRAFLNNNSRGGSQIPPTPSSLPAPRILKKERKKKSCDK